MEDGESLFYAYALRVRDRLQWHLPCATARTTTAY